MTQTKAPGHSRGSRLLALWRERLGLTVREVSARLDLDSTQFSAFVNGRTRPGLKLSGRIELGTDNFVSMRSWLEPDPGALAAVGNDVVEAAAS